jgi:hypothetical protein
MSLGRGEKKHQYWKLENSVLPEDQGTRRLEAMSIGGLVVRKP